MRSRKETGALPQSWRRVVIEGVRPEVDCGLHPCKRVQGEEVVVEADLLADGHEVLRGRLLWRKSGAREWREEPLRALVNDRFRAAFRVTELGRYEYTLEAWVDDFASWAQGLQRKLDAEEDLAIDLLVGAELLRGRAQLASGKEGRALLESAERLAAPEVEAEERAAVALDEGLQDRLERCPDRSRAVRYGRVLEVVVDPPLAGCSAWYEFFPRSTGRPGKHGTFADAERMLPYVADMGFDIVYLPPIHPIGRAHRKGPNNTLRAGPGDPGSPWAIGAAEGGHKSVHPELGDLEAFRSFLTVTREHGMELALDIALQCSPDHPYVRENPEWFKQRPDGTIQYAENPPKKYQDICPFDFECEAWESLWEELRSIFTFWIEQGVTVFRVDNPHTKPLAFWEWCIGSIKAEHPEVVFLSEAFTRPKMMYALAKVGFTQSYTYFSWRRTRWELVEYLTELTRTGVAEFFRPNFWPNTPDILPEDLKHAPRGAFITRLVLAATLAANYGIYGPAFELLENVGRPGSGEYIDNEKYELKQWPLDASRSLRPVIARINRIRKQNPALQRNDRLLFHHCDNEWLICYSKSSADGRNVILVTVNLDYHHPQSGWVRLDLQGLGLRGDERFQVHDLLSEARYDWQGEWNYVELHPGAIPAHVFAVRRFRSREQDFDYFA